jgi:hypothetical protein
MKTPLRKAFHNGVWFIGADYDEGVIIANGLTYNQSLGRFVSTSGHRVFCLIFGVCYKYERQRCDQSETMAEIKHLETIGFY